MKGWDKTLEWNVPKDYVPSTSVTIIVAARNEEKNIGQLIESLLNQNFPKNLIQIIIVDDQSTDSTSNIVSSYAVPVITLLSTAGHKGGKKAAISLAMAIVETDVVICTDADCIPPKEWLMHMVSFYEDKKPTFIAGAIVYESNRSVIQRFQYLDGIGNMAITANGIFTKKYYMANGANMLFEKTLFDEVNGYKNDTVASGDDMMLIQKTAQRYPDRIKFLKNADAAVLTRPVSTLKELVKQRKRWASKSKHYADKGIIKVQSLVFFVILVLLFDLLLIPFTSGISLLCFLVLVAIKLVVDYVFLSKMSHYFNDKKPMSSFFIASILFAFYILWAAFSAILPSTYEWKGREVE